MSSVIERRDKQVWEALENDNVKQALQLCQKRVKKGEKSDSLLALKAYVLARSPPSKQREEGAAEAKAFAFRDPPITDLDTLETIQNALLLFSGGEHSLVEREISTLWDRAAKALPGDESIARSWFLRSFGLRRWKDAQKAAMSLQKAFPRKRDYYFWAIVTSYFVKLDSASSEADRKLFGTLSYKLILKAASDVPNDPRNLLSPGRAIQTPQELALLLIIYQEEGHTKEALEILDSTRLGVWSSVAKGDWSLVRSKLDLLEKLDMWLEAWEFCGGLLHAACPATEKADFGFPRLITHAKGDDWRVWECFLDACEKLDPQGREYRLKTKGILDQYLAQSKRNTRNAQLALLKFVSSDTLSEQGNSANEAEQLSICKQYFKTWSIKTCCFDDLKSYVQRLPRHAQMKFCDHIKICVADDKEGYSREKIASSINILKFDYLLNVSIQPDARLQGILENFIHDCIRVYQSSLTFSAELPTDNLPGDDACILAVMGLVRLGDIESNGLASSSTQTSTLQATALMDLSLSKSRYSYQSMLLVLRLYLMIGAPSLAMEVYSRLSIKQIQNDTLSHNLFTRLSTLHPFPITTTDSTLGRGERDPSLCLGKALQIYRRAETQMPDMAKLALEEGNYSQIRKFLNFEDRVHHSICKVMWECERRRMLRLTQPPSMSSSGDSSAYFPSIMLSDNRDYSVMLTFEADGLPHFEEHVRIGPKPELRWVCAAILTEKLFAAYGAGAFVNVDQMSSILGHLRGITDNVLPAGMTAAERDNMTIVIELTNLMMAMVSSKTDVGTHQGDQGLMLIEKWLTTRLSGLMEERMAMNLEKLTLNGGRNGPNWKFLHESFLMFDVLRAILMFLDFASVGARSAAIGLQQSAVDRTRELVDKVHQELRSRSADMKDSLSESGVIGSLIDTIYEREQTHTKGLGTAIEGLISEFEMEKFISRVVESWQDALDGVLRVKLK